MSSFKRIAFLNTAEKLSLAVNDSRDKCCIFTPISLII